MENKNKRKQLINNILYIHPLAELKCSYNDIQKVAHVVDFQ